MCSNGQAERILSSRSGRSPNQVLLTVDLAEFTPGTAMEIKYRGTFVVDKKVDMCLYQARCYDSEEEALTDPSTVDSTFDPTAGVFNYGAVVEYG